MNNQSYSKRFFFAFLVLFNILVGAYFWHRHVKYGPGIKLQKLIQAEQAADYARAMADTYGGKTPQETLAMYIDAVEKGDYELASKYFIEGNRQKAIDDLNNSSREKINNYLDLLKKALVLKVFGAYYSRDTFGGQEFINDELIHIRMDIYPNGIWKIVEI